MKNDYFRLRVSTIDRIVKQASAKMRSELLSIARRTMLANGDVIKLSYEITIEFNDEKDPGVRID